MDAGGESIPDRRNSPYEGGSSTKTGPAAVQKRLGQKTSAVTVSRVRGELRAEG